MDRRNNGRREEYDQRTNHTFTLEGRMRSQFEEIPFSDDQYEYITEKVSKKIVWRVTLTVLIIQVGIFGGIYAVTWLLK
jgi:hypothetical protein